MNDNPLLERRIRSFASSVDDSDWEEVVRRAGVNRRMSPTRASGRRGLTPPGDGADARCSRSRWPR